MEFLIVTGPSGAGKSRAINALEDIGYYCVDNMPPNLLPTFARLFLQSHSADARVAIVVDVRSGPWFRQLFDHLDALAAEGASYKILFLDCDDKALTLRYKETRRQHPLAAANDNSVAKAIAAERLMLRPVRARTDYLIDTSLLSVAQLRERIISLFSENTEGGMAVQCLSFGFKYGYPNEADLVFDVRCLPNPFYEEELKYKTGLDAEVCAYVLENDEARGFLERFYSFIDYMLPLYLREGKSQLVIAVGCTGGKHRSVAIAEQLAKHISWTDYRVVVNHRDIQKP